MKLIGLNGPAGSGKDTFAKLLTENYHDKTRVQIAPFADPLKRIASDLFLVPINYFYEDHLKEELLYSFGYKHSPRQLLTLLGTDFVRNQVSQDLWLNHVKRMYSKASILGEIDLFIITDVRFINEADWIRQERGYTISIQREEPLRTRKCSNPNHESERPLPSRLVPFYVSNNSSLEDLTERAKELLQYVLQG